MLTEALNRHCAEIDRCNQRGGRMLSIVDLIEADTVSVELAAYALAAIGGGASFMVGALPGGAGKTTVMGALLNFVPAAVPLLPADEGAMLKRRAPAHGRRCCYVCHEIGPGPYYAYLWGAPLRAYFELAAAGHTLATNLHADTYPQARAQICRDNRVSAEALCRMNLMFFLDVSRSGGNTFRRIVEVWESDGHQPHRRVFAAGAPLPLAETSTLVSAAEMARAHRRIEQLSTHRARTIEQVRAVVVATDESAA